ncbi:1,4-dihydroxy-2-naphthoate octaprenyltransferase [Bifidobacterium sp.]|jgi:1,4-dihydroxy-2-naphthoate octaprenyltransferase|uniref:1,4-dihydroxy-2-naphthoate octaprenyltransferase n=1 Tax=Bifidobacterium sp. TaxID=41200 RepID=UPI0025C3E11C|nr:1,4-dihydroxy-2-naphthoate octaprenyltransferase [Bifidobacterium sp.]MCH4209586.1 1,4-dihydroxy-2-naphthoate octaprenyltransferase [Bifidobacterium sp.]MCI1225015.1 1,4-dihydroxy-2-naphthoate octaprenyltransferase [Bifidobacterium sp.]
MKLGLWLRGARPKTLPLGLAPVIAAVMTMWQTVFAGVYGGSYDHRPCPVFGGRPPYPVGDYGRCLTAPGWYIAVASLCAGVAIFLQIAANFANDYSDGKRGVDSGRGIGGASIVDGELGMRGSSPADSAHRARVKARSRAQSQYQSQIPSRPAKEPIGSGVGASRLQAPSRLVASGVAPKKVLAAAGISAALACVCGLAIIMLTGHWWLAALGLACIVAGWFYVGGEHPYGYHGWGEASAFVFFGLIAACGTAYALSDTVPYLIIWVGIAQGLLAVAVLSVNNLRDVDDDAAHGKRTWMVRMGERRGRRFAEAMVIVPVLMLAGEFVARVPWQHVQGMAQDACGTNDAGRIVCNYAPALRAQYLFYASGALLAVTCVLCLCAVLAIQRRNHRAALPLCSFLSLAVAFAFGTLHLIAM